MCTFPIGALHVRGELCTFVIAVQSETNPSAIATEGHPRRHLVVLSDPSYLLPWAHEGVFLLNATLTVREGHKEANSHSNCGWQRFTDEVIKVLNDQKEGIVFLLWGGNAQKKAGALPDLLLQEAIDAALMPEAATEAEDVKDICRKIKSPLQGEEALELDQALPDSRCQMKCNAELEKLGKGKIDWLLPSLPEKMET
eukprot:s5813_g3.t1